MAETRGTFILSEVLLEIKDNNWVPPEQVYLNTPIPNAGYFGGGQTVGPVLYSTMDKVTYASDTTVAVPGAALSLARRFPAAIGNSIAGYFGGGAAPGGPGFQVTMDKVSYAADTTAAVPGAALSAARYALAATGNSTSGYFGGGYGPGSPGPVSTMDKLTYSTDTTANVPSLSNPRNYHSATGNSTSGYFGGGFGPGSPGPVSTMDKLTYSTDTTAQVPGANLSSARSQSAATGNSSAGYFSGGIDSVQNNYSTTDKLTYASDTTAAVPGAALSVARGALGATGNSIAGYFGGGASQPGPVAYSTTDKITFSNDTRVATIPGLSLSVARYGVAASSLRANGLPSTPIANTVTGSNFVSKGSSFNTGYFGGGQTPSTPTNVQYSTMDKVTYSTDTAVRIPGGNLSTARWALAATGNSTVGYFGGGASLPLVSTVDKITYSTDTTAVAPTTAFLSVARNNLGATGNSIAGYFAGGRTPALRSTVDKITYSTDTTVAVPGAFLSRSLEWIGGTGNSTAGYFSAGFDGTNYVSTIDKITYSTDTRTSISNLSSSRGVGAATGSSTAGYFGGGSGISSAVDKLTYSTETSSSIATAALSFPRAYHSATGNSTLGYFGGGFDATNARSTMDKLDYTTEITSRIPGASLSAARYGLAASSSTANALPQQDITATPQAIQGNTGYFGGGWSLGPIVRSTFDKLTYSTDTTAAVPGTGLNVPRYGLAATGNSTSGYFAGGATIVPSTASNSIMDKITYASDTTIRIPGGNLSVARERLAAIGNEVTGGYFGGGFAAATLASYSTTDKVSYSTDTTAAVPGAALRSARYYVASTGNSTAGYFGGGASPTVSTTDKLTYSTETTATVPGASLSSARSNLAATGNSTFGYFGGGGVSTMDKISYSTDTTSVAPTAAFLTVARNSMAATGNLTTGYFGGSITSTDKVSYSTDTTVATPGAGTSVLRSQPAASSSVANAVRGTVPQVPIV